jgi:hypothetical protein
MLSPWLMLCLLQALLLLWGAWLQGPRCKPAALLALP